MKIFNPAYPLISELTHGPHHDSLIRPLSLIPELLQAGGALYAFKLIYTEAEPDP